MSGERCVVISPHLDDAVLSAWLVLRPGTTVVTCFAGGDDELSAARRAEDGEVLGRLDVDAVHLPFGDLPQRDGEEVEVLAALTTALSPLVSTASSVWLPVGIGRHEDHVLARQAARRATPASCAVHLYADMPYAARGGWPAFVTTSARSITVLGSAALRGPRSSAAKWVRAGIGAGVRPRRIRPRVVRLTEPQQRAKLDAVRGYRSQSMQLGYGGDGGAPPHDLLDFEAWWDLP